MLLVTSRKYYCEWANGTTFASNTSDFATHLKGSIGERLKAVYRVKTSLITVCSDQNQFTIMNPGNVIERINGSWIDEGYQTGMTLYLINDWTTGTGTGIDAGFGLLGNVITVVTDKYLYFTTPVASTYRRTYTNDAFLVTDKFTGLYFNYGLIENNATTSFQSPFSNDVQGFYFGSIDTSTPTVHTMTAINGSTKSWLSGDATVKYLASSDDYSITLSNVHEYEITLSFVITPTFIERFLDSYENGTRPEEFSANNSIKIVTGYEFRTIISNPNTSVKGEDSYLLGSVAWINENYNGLNNIYSISNVAYLDTTTSDAVDGLQSGKRTRVTGSIIGSGFTNSYKACAYIWYSASLSQYESNYDSFQSVFLWDSQLATMTSGSVVATGTERIKRFELTYVSATRIDFKIDIELSSSEQTIVEDSLNSYFVGIQIGNTNSTDTSNKVILQVDYAPFVINDDVEGLVRFENEGIYPHNLLVSSGGHTDYKGWKQDGIVVKFDLYLNKFLNAKLKALRFKTIAYNEVSGDSFDINSFTFPLTDMIEQNNVQYIDVNASRNFKLGSTDQFNDIELTSFEPVGTEQKISAQVGVKLDWQSWVKLIGASVDFYDTALPQKGLQTDASRYTLGDWVVKFAVECDAKQLTEDITTYRHLSTPLSVYDWDLEDDDPAEWSVLIETFDLDGNDLGGAILKNKDTKVKCTWTPLSGSTTGFNNRWAVHRIEKVNTIGQNEIDELSTIWTPRLNNLLKPVAGQTLLKLTDFSTYIETECLVDYTRLSNTSYNLSARLGRRKTYPRYGIARDIKYLSENEIVYFNCPDNGVAVSNSLRIAQIDTDGNITTEVAVTLSALYTYQNFKLVISDVVTNGKVNFYAITYTGAATEVHEFTYNGTIYTQTRIYTANLGGGTYTTIRIDPVIGQVNSKPYFWIGNSQANIGGQRGFKHLYYNGSAWTTLDFQTYQSGSPSNNQLRYPIDVIFDGTNAYIMNLDLPPNANQWEQGKIAVYSQTSGSTTSPSDRANFSNWTFSYNVYRNSGDTENQDGLGDNADLTGAVGFEIVGLDTNSLPIFLVVHDVTLGDVGARHFSRVFCNVASPNSSDDWTIQTPMAATNLLYGTPHALMGTANGSTASSKLQRKNQCHLLIVNENEFVCGHQSAFYWTKFVISDWTGVGMNRWGIFTPQDPLFDYTSGNILNE
jgi:hypothetical protein